MLPDAIGGPSLPVHSNLSILRRQARALVTPILILEARGQSCATKKRINLQINWFDVSDCQSSGSAEHLTRFESCMTEKEYKALYEALEAAHKILPGAKGCDEKDAELRKKIRKLEKAVLKRQKKAARADSKEKKG